MLFIAELGTTGEGARCHTISTATRSVSRYFGGAVISMAQIAAGRIYIEAR